MQETADKAQGREATDGFVCCDPIAVMLGLDMGAAEKTSFQRCKVEQEESAGRCSITYVSSLEEANVVLCQKMNRDTLLRQLAAVMQVLPGA